MRHLGDRHHPGVVLGPAGHLHVSGGLLGGVALGGSVTFGGSVTLGATLDILRFLSLRLRARAGAEFGDLLITPVKGR